MRSFLSISRGTPIQCRIIFLPFLCHRSLARRLAPPAMPPLAQPEPLIPEPPTHQRHRSDSIDLTCSSGSSSFLGKLWPSTRSKVASPFKNASCGAPEEILGLSRLSKFSGISSKGASIESPNSTSFDRLHCYGESLLKDCNDWQLKERLELEAGADRKGLHCKQLSVWANLEDKNVECCRELITCAASGKTEECGEVNSEGGSTEGNDLGVKPIMESLKGVMIGKKQRTSNGSEAKCGHGIKKDSKLSEAASNASGVNRKDNREEGADQRLMKRNMATFKPGDVSNACNVKKMRMSTLSELQRVADMLQWGRASEERWFAADELRRVCKDDAIARVTLGVQLGAIPPLISLLHSPDRKHQCTALLALLNLAVGNDVNKGAIVKEGAIPRMERLLHSTHTEVQTATVSLFLSLSAMDGNKGVIGTSGSVPILVSLLLSQHTKKDALRTIYNLSILSDNGRVIVEAGGVPSLLVMVSDAKTAAKSLGTLSNLVQTEVAQQKFAEHKEALYAALVESMRLTELPKCQERAVYVLMMMMHHSGAQHEAMAAAGVIPALIELSLLGSPLAQKRAMRTLDGFRRAKAFSAPQLRESAAAGADCMDPRQSAARTMSEKKVVDDLVRQSLRRTMQRISRRANMSRVLGDPHSVEVMMSSEAMTRSFCCAPDQKRISTRSFSY